MRIPVQVVFVNVEVGHILLGIPVKTGIDHIVEGAIQLIVSKQCSFLLDLLVVVNDLVNVNVILTVGIVDDDKLTENDIKKMQEEIDYRKLVVRPKELEAVKEARAQGDLSENFEYKAAKQDKNRNESRIRYLEKMIKTAHVISDTSKDDEVGINNTVQVYIEEDDETETYKLVTTVRGNSLKGYVSIDSPLGKAILGHKVGDRVTVKVSDAYSYDLIIKSIENTADTDDELRSY